jgi:tape measure domain-containing protein
VAFDIGELLAKLKVDSTQFDDKVKSSEDKLTGLRGTAQRLGSGLQSMMQGVGQFAGMQVMNGLAAAVGFAKDAVFGFNATLQNSTIAFTTMLGSATKAQSFLTDLQKFAKSTPFEFQGLVQTAQNMMGMGIAAKDVIPDLTALGDSVASIGGSQEQVKQVTLAFDQMAAKGTLDMGNMNQLMEGGVPNALKIMASAYKVTTGQMIEMISTGKVQSSVALPALIQGLEKGTASTAALGGMMAKQSQTFTGALSNIADGLQQAIAGAFKPFFDVAAKGAVALGNFFSGDKFSAFGAAAESGMTKAFAAVKSFNFSPIIIAFQRVVAVVKNDLLPIGKDLIKTFGPPLVAAFGLIYSSLGPLSSALKPIGDLLKDVFGFVAAHSTSFQALAVAILSIVAAYKLWALAQGALTLVTKAAAAVQWLLDAAMAANPIGLIIVAVIALVAAFAYLWTHSSAFRNFWIGLWGQIWGFLKAVGAWFAGPFASFFVAAWQMISAGALWLWHNVLDPMWQNIRSTIAFVLNIVTSFANLWAFLWRNTIGAAILWLWHNVWEPAASGIATAAMWLWHNVIEPMARGISAAAQAIGTAAMWLWHNAIDPAFHAIAAVASWLWNNAISPTFNLVMGIVHKVGDTFRSVFGAIGGFISSAFSSAVGIVKGAVNGIISAVNSAISGINSVISAANSIPGVSFPHIPSIPHLAQGGVVGPSKGGTPVVMGDGGQVEYGVPKSDMQAIIGQAVAAGGGGAGGVLTLIIKGDGILAGIRKTVRVQGGSAQTVLVGV